MRHFPGLYGSSRVRTVVRPDQLPDPRIPETRGRGYGVVVQGVDPTETNIDHVQPEELMGLYGRMRNHHVIGAALLLFELAITQAERMVVPGDQSEKAKEAAKDLEENLENLEWRTPDGGLETQSFSDVLRHALLMLSFGFSIDIPVYRPDGNRIRLKRFAPRLPMTVEEWIPFDTERGSLKAVRQYRVAGVSLQDDRDCIIPGNRMTLYIYNRQGESFTGRALIRPLLGPWTHLKGAENVAALAIARNQMGVPYISTTDPNATLRKGEREVCENTVKRLSASEEIGVVLPSGFDLKFAATPLEDSTPYLRHWNQSIAQGCLMAILSAGMEQSGGYSRIFKQSDLATMAVEGVARVLTDSFPKWIRRRHEYNYDNVPCPKFQFGPFAVPDPEVIRAVLVDMAQSGFADPRDPDMRAWAAKRFGYPVPPKPTKSPTADAPAGSSSPDQSAQVNPEAGVQTELTLNGAQIESALLVIQELQAGKITAVQATELLVAVGIPRDRVRQMVAVESPTPETKSPNSSLSAVAGWKPRRALTQAEQFIALSEIYVGQEVAFSKLGELLTLAARRFASEAAWKLASATSLSEIKPPTFGTDAFILASLARKCDEVRAWASASAQSELSRMRLGKRYTAMSAVDELRFSPVEIREASNEGTEFARAALKNVEIEVSSSLSREAVRLLQAGETLSAGVLYEFWGASPNTLSRLAKTTAMQAYNLGRHTALAADAGDGETARWGYSAIMDENTCTVCSSWDGKEGPRSSLPQVPNPECVGERYGNACRCMLYRVLESEQPASDGGRAPDRTDKTGPLFP